MAAPSIRPPLPARLVRLASALLESGVLLAMGAMFFSGSVASPEGEGPPLPLRLSPAAGPFLAATGAYALLRLTRPRKHAFAAAAAVVCALGAALRPGLLPLARPLDGLRGLLVGALVGGLLMPLDGEGDALLAAGAAPWRELLFGSLLVFFGSLPAAAAGGFLLAAPTISLGLGVLARGLWFDARLLARGGGRGGALTRLTLGLPIALLGLGLAVVTPLLSFGRGPWSAP